MLIPHFSQSLRDDVVTIENRDQFVEGWLKGLEALHAAGMVHFGMGLDALLIHTDPKTQEVWPVIGGFSRAFLLTEAPYELLNSEDFSKCMPPECKRNVGFQMFVKIPENPRAVDVYQMGCWLKHRYLDVFGDTAVVPTRGMIDSGKVPRKGHILYVINTMMYKGDPIVRLTAKRALTLWQKMPEQ